jgi:hypothetical protein
MRVVLPTLTMFGALTSPQALAIIEGNSAIGYRTTKITCCDKSPTDKTTATGFEAQLGGFVDPFPILPMAVGGTIYYHRTRDQEDIVSSSGWGIDVEAKIWYPIPRVPFTLFAKGGYSLIGGNSVSRDENTDQYSPNGLVVSGGIRLDILFRGAVFVQGTYRQTELKGKKETFQDTSATFLGGVQVGF